MVEFALRTPTCRLRRQAPTWTACGSPAANPRYCLQRELAAGSYPRSSHEKEPAYGRLHSRGGGVRNANSNLSPPATGVVLNQRRCRRLRIPQEGIQHKRRASGLVVISTTLVAGPRGQNADYRNGELSSCSSTRTRSERGQAASHLGVASLNSSVVHRTTSISAGSMPACSAMVGFRNTRDTRCQGLSCAVSVGAPEWRS